MEEELLIRAIEEDVDKLKDVLRVSYSLKASSKLEVLEVATETNRLLGYELFNDLYYPRLVTEFSLIARVVAKDAMENNN